MRDYLYIPLGGNRVSARRLYFNLWVVFLISGLWHGAAWNFVIWGAFHGLFLVADRMFLLKWFRAIGKIPSIVITFFISLVSWVFFRAENLVDAWEYLGKMFSFRSYDDGLYFDQRFYTILGVAFFFAFWGGFRRIERWQEKLFSESKPMQVIAVMVPVSIILFIVCVGAITSSGFNPFIYFRF
jgi:alginate O-acetyltransferase complex protein AlgI